MTIAHPSPEAQASGIRTWAPVLVGIVLLYVPVYLDLYRDFWRADRGTHGAVIVAMVAWLLWRSRNELLQMRRPEAPVMGIALFGFGLLLYVLGRANSVHQLQVVSQIPLLLGVAYLLHGAAGLKRTWLPIALLVFIVPIPGSLLDQLLLPLKELVSSVVDTTLHWLGYPIARDGVVLLVGPYRLLIADACSGLNSMVALTGIGLLYVHVAGHSSRALNAALLLSILPIAFLANIIRVMALVLVTYYGGEGSGRAFHDQASILEIALAFGGFFAFDRFLTFCAAARRRAVSAGDSAREPVRTAVPVNQTLQA